MSLRAIQKRDREKLSSSQRARVGATAPPAAMKMTAATAAACAAPGGVHVVPSVQSILESQHASRKQRAQLQPGASVLTVASTHPQQLRRACSCPSLLPDGAGRWHSTKHPHHRRAVRSESDLGALRDHLVVLATGRETTNSFSTNNLYLGAKSEVCLKTLAVKNTLHGPVSFVKPAGMQQALSAPGTPGVRSEDGSGSGSTHAPSRRLYESRRASELSCSDIGTGKTELALKTNAHAVRIPIVGYEVMEERARFTIFKLRIENSISHTCWLVLRRYTDFVRLNNKLRTMFPHCNLVLPRKKWFGDNFSSGFIDNRIQGLQTFINTILGDATMRQCQAVRDFFCLDEPPSYSESMEESRVIFEAQEETISQLKQQLQAKDDMVQALQTKLATELNRNKILANVVRNSVENCAKCSKSADQLMKQSVYK